MREISSAVVEYFPTCASRTHTRHLLLRVGTTRAAFLCGNPRHCVSFGRGSAPAGRRPWWFISSSSLPLYIFPPFFCSCCPAQKKNKQENNEMRWRRRSVGWFMTSKWAVQTRWASFLFVYFSVVVSLYVTATRGEKRGCVRLCAGRNACLLRLRWTNVSALTRFRCVERKRERLFLPACIYIYSLVVVENEWKTV